MANLVTLALGSEDGDVIATFSRDERIDINGQSSSASASSITFIVSGVPQTPISILHLGVAGVLEHHITAPRSSTSAQYATTYRQPFSPFSTVTVTVQAADPVLFPLWYRAKKITTVWNGV